MASPLRSTIGEGFEAGQLERRVGDAGGVEAHQTCGAKPVFALRSSGELVADPGDGGARRALVSGLAFEAEVALPAFAGIEALHHRAHEGKVADVQLALSGGAWLGQAVGRMMDRAVRDGKLDPLPCLRRAFTRLPLARVMAWRHMDR